MGSADVQGGLWGRSPDDWLDLQEDFSVPLWNSMLDAAGVEGGSRLLDAGCGAGGAGVLAYKRGATVTGLDASEGLLAVAKHRIPDADFEVGDLEALPFGDAVFDAVIAASSIQYAEDPARAVNELSRVLRPGGRAAVGLFSTPDKVEYSVILQTIRDSLPDPPRGDGPFALSQPGALEMLVGAAGMNVIEVGEVDCPFIFSDYEALWRGCISAGPVQAALNVVDAGELRQRIEEAAAPYRQVDGTIRFEVAFRYVGAGHEHS